MPIEPNSPVVWLLGALGGLIPDLLRILNLVKSGQPVSGALGWRLWVSLVILIPLGAFTAWLLQSSTAIQALACGFSAPEVLSRVLSNKSNLPPGGGGGPGPTERGEEKAPPIPGPAPPAGQVESFRSWWAL
jgi:hypothetical protein